MVESLLPGAGRDYRGASRTGFSIPWFLLQRCGAGGSTRLCEDLACLGFLGHRLPDSPTERTWRSATVRGPDLLYLFPYPSRPLVRIAFGRFGHSRQGFRAADPVGGSLIRG